MEPTAMIGTIGHSSRTAQELIGLLKAEGAERLVDVRARPGSRRFPWFGRRPLARHLEEAGIGYRHCPAFGGKRESAADSPHQGLARVWQRAYADWMESSEFRCALEVLIAEAETMRVVLMCAEGDPRQCHRWLIADALFCRGVMVRHWGTPVGSVDHAGSDSLVCLDGWPAYPFRLAAPSG